MERSPAGRQRAPWGHGSGAVLPYGSFQVLGTLGLDFDYGPDSIQISDYRRVLDLDSARCLTRCEAGGIYFERKTIAGFGDDVIAMELSCDRLGGLTFTASLSRPERATVISRGDEIRMHGQLELAEAARVTLERRGDASTGWSMAWKINFRARLGDGNHAYKLLKDLLRPFSSANYSFNYTNGGGTYINLFDTHPPFQIDGNFGGCAAITEMLLQSHDGFILFLPALPDAWREGQFKGLAARGGIIANLIWKDHQVQEVIIRATKTNSIQIMNPFQGEFETRRNGDRENFVINGQMIELTVKPGDEIQFKSL